MPVVLQPAREQVTGDIVGVLRVRERVLDEPRDRQQRLQVPGRRVVPNREEGREVGRRRTAQRVDRASAPQAPAEVVQEPHVLAAHLHIVPASPFVRRGEVVANVGGVLPRAS